MQAMNAAPLKEEVVQEGQATALEKKEVQEEALVVQEAESVVEEKEVVREHEAAEQEKKSARELEEKDEERENQPKKDFEPSALLNEELKQGGTIDSKAGIITFSPIAPLVAIILVNIFNPNMLSFTFILHWKPL